MNEIKSCKAPGLDGLPVECLEKGGVAAMELLVRRLNVRFNMDVVHMDWHGACIVPLFKVNGDKCSADVNVKEC